MSRRENTPSDTQENFLSALESLGGSAGTQEIADEVSCAYRTAHAKLTELEGEGKLTSKGWER